MRTVKRVAVALAGLPATEVRPPDRSPEASYECTAASTWAHRSSQLCRRPAGLVGPDMAAYLAPDRISNRLFAGPIS